MTTKPNRHKMIEVSCKWCGEKFMARKQRVDKGQSQFCSMEHYREYQNSIGSQRKNIGKENAIIQWDDSVNMYRAYWYDENGKYHSEPWARWAWELNFGEVPDGYRIGYKDGNSKNDTIENIIAQSPGEFGRKMSVLEKGKKFSEKHKKAISNGRLGMKLSEEHRKHIGDANRKKWASGFFDTIHKGKYNKHWRGGIEKGYTYDFESLRVFVRDRDNYMCQICGKHLHKTRDSHVHHIDGNKKHNEMDNLILLCTSCHGKVHAKNPAPPAILAFRAKLEWNQNDQN